MDCQTLLDMTNTSDIHSRCQRCNLIFCLSCLVLLQKEICTVIKYKDNNTGNINLRPTDRDSSKSTCAKFNFKAKHYLLLKIEFL